MHYDGIDQVPAPHLIHRPIRRPRTTFTRECMFAASWLRLMDSPTIESDRTARGYVTKLESILSLYPHEITQRTASIAASFITWLGTNNGSCFLMEARKLSEILGSAERGYIAAWAIENRRAQGINNSVKTIEAILSSEASDQDLFGYRPNAPILSAAEVEVADLLVEWIACQEGRAFVSKCESEISLLQKAQAAEQSRHRKNHENSNNSEVSSAP